MPYFLLPDKSLHNKYGGFHSLRQLSARLIANAAAGVSYPSSFSKLSEEPREDKFG